MRNLTALGAAVAFISVVGDDQAGSDLTALIGGQPERVEPWLLVQGGRITTLKTRYLSGRPAIAACRPRGNLARAASAGGTIACAVRRATPWRRLRSPCCRITRRG